MKSKFCLSLIVTSFLFFNSLLSQERHWQYKYDMPTARSGICAAVLNGQIYVMGGRNQNSKILKLVERYDAMVDRWDSSFPNMKKERENAAAVIYKGKIFVLGGRSKEDKILNKVEYFDVQKNEWENFKDLKEKRQGLTAVVLNGVLYAIGGLGEKKGDNNSVNNNEDLFLNSVEYFDESKEKWIIKDNWHLEMAKASFASVLVKDSVFSVGGFSRLGPLPYVQRYHNTNGAANRKEMMSKRGGLTAIAVNNNIYVIGGQTPYNTASDSVEIYEPQKNSWHVDSLLINTARVNFASVTVNNTIYVMGGIGRNGRVLASVESIGVPFITHVSDLMTSTPANIMLEQNYPNPFNPGTKIEFQISSTRASRVKLTIYNIYGQLIKILTDEKLLPGEYVKFWQGTDQDGFQVASGIYIYALQVGERKIAKKMTRLK